MELELDNIMFNALKKQSILYLSSFSDYHRERKD